MADLGNFNAGDVEPLQPFDALPAGEYPAAIIASEMRDTRSGNGRYLNLEFEVVDGPHRGRKLWTRLNLQNPSEDAVAFARAELASICRAVGVLQPKDSTTLHNVPLVLTVKVRKREDTGELVNEVRGYSKRESAPSPTPPKTPSSKPWGR